MPPMAIELANASKKVEFDTTWVNLIVYLKS